MNIRLLLALTITAGSLASCVYPHPPKRPVRPRTGANLDRPASGERSARETRYLEQEVTQQPQAPATPPADGAPASGTAEVQAPNNATPPPVTAEAPPDKPKTEAPKETPPPSPSPATPELPYGKPVPGKKGFVYSPYDQSAGFVDVRDISPGTKVRCPYTGKIFRVP